MKSDDELDSLLRLSKPTMAIPHTFQAELWRRIAMAEDGSLGGRLSRWLRPLLSLVGTPPKRMTLCAVMVVGGLWFGRQRMDAGRDGRLAYLESVSPFMVAHRSGK